MPGMADARLLYFLEIGRKLASEHPGQQVKEVAFIAMSWASFQPLDQPSPSIRPSKDPNRKELLVIQHLMVNAEGTMKLDGEMVEILRDGKGRVHDLYHLPAEVQEGQSPMLMLFVLGFNYPQTSNREIMHRLQALLGPQ